MQERKFQLSIFIFFSLFYSLFLGDYSKEAFYSSDEIFYFRLTQSLVEHRSLEVEPYLGYHHSKYMPGQSVAGMPAYLLARALMIFIPAVSDASIIILFLVHLTNVLIGAWLCLAFYKFGQELGYGRRASLAGALALGLATTFFPYSKQYFSEPLAALLILACIMFLNRALGGKKINAVFAGLTFGAAMLTKIDTAFLLIPIAIWMLYYHRRVASLIARFAAGVAPLLCLVLLYNQLNYGNALKPGYERQAFVSPFFSGIFGLLFSPSRGLFLFSLPVIIAFMGLTGFHKKFPLLLSLCAGIVLVRIAILAKWFSWQGGWCWGPRLLLPVMPLFFLPALEVFEKWRLLARWIRITILGILAAGLFVQFMGSMISPNKYNNDIWGMLPGGMNEFLFIPQLSTIKGNLFLLSQGKLDSGWLYFLRTGGTVSAVLFSLHLAATLFLLGMLLREMGLGEKGWLNRLIPDARGLLTPAILIVLVLLVSHIILRGQGLDTLRYAYIEEEKPVGVALSPRTFSGYLYAPIEGKYQFALKVLGAYHILIDGKLLFLNERDEPQRWDFATSELTKGFHAIAGQYNPRTDADIALMHLYWTIPDGAEYKSLIGPQYLSKRPPSQMRQILLRIVQFRAWLLLACLFLPGLFRLRANETAE